MRSRLRANTPASIPENRNSTGRHQHQQQHGPDVSHQIAAPPVFPQSSTTNSLTRRSSTCVAPQAEIPKSHRMPGRRHHLGQRHKKSAHRVDIRHSPKSGYSRRKSSSRIVPLTRQRPGPSRSTTNPPPRLLPECAPPSTRECPPSSPAPMCSSYSSTTMATPRLCCCRSAAAAADSWSRARMTESQLSRKDPPPDSAAAPSC